MVGYNGTDLKNDDQLNNGRACSVFNEVVSQGVRMITKLCNFKSIEVTKIYLSKQVFLTIPMLHSL